jgi:hypothetical protein
MHKTCLMLGQLEGLHQIRFAFGVWHTKERALPGGELRTPPRDVPARFTERVG